jgi:hypothetical protein
LAITTADRENSSKGKKIGGKVQFTYEVLNQLLHIPEECRIVNVVGDANRDIASFIFHSDEVIPGTTFEVGEGMEYPNTSISMEHYGLNALRVASEIIEKAAIGGRENEWAVTALEMFLEEEEEQDA